MVTDDSETFCLDKLESEIAGVECGAPDRSGVSKNVPNKYR